MNQQRTRKVITTTATPMTTLLQECLISEDPTSIMLQGAKRNRSLGICSIFEPHSIFPDTVFVAPAAPATSAPATRGERRVFLE